MLTIRPLAFSDLQALERLAVSAGGNLTTLPANRDHLSELINRTRQSLRQSVSRPGDQSYHFVLEGNDGELMGIAGIEAAVGLNSPFYSYRLDEVVHASSELKVHNRIPSMHLCQDFDGYSRLYTFYLAPQHHKALNLQLLSRARLLFMAQHAQRFARKTLVELQGVVDEHGQSPLWECLGRHFFSMELERANYLTGIDAKGFIADLMPHYPVYLPMLPETVRRTLGQPRPDIADTMRLLSEEGFRHLGYVDIFDAGPTLEARTAAIRSVQQSKCIELRHCEQPAGPSALVCNTQLEGFRCVITRIDPANPALCSEIAQQLKLSAGDSFRYIPLDQGA